MLVWLSSYPRSGNTFLRITLNRLYGVRTSTVYDIDGVAQRLGDAAVGFEERPASLPEMRASAHLHFIKTHRQRDDDFDDDRDLAICLVRDGRDAIVSWARQRCEEPGHDFRAELARMITHRKPRGTSTWGDTVLSWVRPPSPRRVVLHFEELTRDPRTAIAETLSSLGLDLSPQPGAVVPSFAELHETDPGFFRRGRTGSHQDELPEDLHRLFWSQPENAAAMALRDDL